MNLQMNLEQLPHLYHMRIANLLFLLLLSLGFLPLSISAQTSQNPWALSLGGGVARYIAAPNAVQPLSSVYDPVFTLGGTRYLRGGFDFRTQIAGSKVRYPLGEDRMETSWMDMSYQLLYKFNNGLFLKEESFIGPYLLLGIGGSYAYQQPDAYVPLGGGIRFKVSPQFSIRVETVRKISLNKQPQHLAHQIAFVYNLPSGDAIDLPETGAGSSKILALVPQDRDQDGIADIEDNCPEKPGSLSLNGCPENDTVPSKFVQTKDPIKVAEDPALILEQVLPKNQEEAMVYYPVYEPAATTSQEVSELLREPSGELGNLSDLLSGTMAAPKSAPVALTQALAAPEVNARKRRPEIDLSPCAEYTAGESSLTPVLFELGSDELAGEALERLDYIAGAMKACSDITLMLDGHADAYGQEETNLVLSIKRAYNVKYYLVYQHGISQHRIISAGWGEAQPVADNVSLQGREQNRRVDFQFVF